MGWYKNHKSGLIVGGGALIAGVLSFFITLSVYPNIKNNTIKSNGDKKIIEENKIVNNEKIEDVEKVIAQNIVSTQNDFKEENGVELQNNIQTQDEELKNTQQYDLKNENVMNVEKNDEKHYVAESDKTGEDDEGKIVEAIAISGKEKEDNNENEKNIELELPVSGDIITEFAKDKLVFSETLNEWITHDGVDILGEVASPVKASADGIIESIKMDPRYGNTIIINHGDECKTIYSNLSTLELVYTGKKVKQGEIISGIGEGFGFESKEGAHLHFEVLKDGKNVDPLKQES